MADNAGGCCPGDMGERPGSAAAMLQGTLGSLADCVRDIVLTMRRDGQIVGANAAAIAAYGHPLPALLAMNIRDLRAGVTRPDLPAQMAQAERAGLLFETVHCRADGSEFPVEVSSAAAMMAEDRVLISVIRDISDRKRSELALAEIATSLQLTLDAGGMGRWEVDLATGARSRDRRVLALCGLPADAGADDGPLFDSLVHPEDRALRDAALHDALQGRGEYRCEFRIRRADTGEVRWLAARGHVVGDRSGRPVRLVGVNFDVTERRAAEDAARERADHLRIALEAGRMAVWERDIATDRIRISPQLNRVLGFPAEAQPTTEQIRAQYGRGERDRLRRIAESAIERKDRFAEVEFRYRRPDGALRWLMIRAEVQHAPDGRPTRMMGVILDITERRQAEQALRESEERMRLALRAARMSTWSYDVRAGLATRSGNLVGDQPALAREQFTLSEWLAYVHPEDRETLRQAIEAVIAGERDGLSVEYRLRRPEVQGGGWIWIATHGAVVERDHGSGSVTRLAGIGLDVTERKETEERQKLLMREVDHRAKNALAVVQSVLRLTPKDDVRAYADAVEGRVRALARAHSLLAEQRWSGADMRVLIEAELAPFQCPLGAGEGLSVPRVDLSGPGLRVAAEAAQALSMMFHELATNAVKHGALSAPSGVVRLSWEVDRAEQQLLLAWREEGGPPIAGEPSRRGFGSRVIEMTVESLLSGVVDRQWRPGGLSYLFVIPLKRMLGDGCTVALDRLAMR